MVNSGTITDNHILLFSGVLTNISKKDLAIWSFLSVLTIYPNITPGSIKELLLTGDPNGSLWTIPIEIQFYLVIPLLFILLKKFKPATGNLFIVLLIVLSALFNYCRKIWAVDYLNPIFWKFIACSVLPFFWNFGLGMLLFLNWNRLQKYFAGKVLLWICIYTAVILLSIFLIDQTGNEFYLWNFICMILLSCLVISFAYSYTNLSSFLKRNDISYGVYIYHMPISNLFILQFGIGTINNLTFFLLILAIIYILSYFSWKYIESPALSLKKYR